MKEYLTKSNLPASDYVMQILFCYDNYIEIYKNNNKEYWYNLASEINHY